MKRTQRLRLARKTKALKEETRTKLWAEVEAVAGAAIATLPDGEFASRDEGLAAARVIWSEIQILQRLVHMDDQQAFVKTMEAIGILWRLVHQFELTEEEVKA